MVSTVLWASVVTENPVTRATSETPSLSSASVNFQKPGYPPVPEFPEIPIALISHLSVTPVKPEDVLLFLQLKEPS